MAVLLGRPDHVYGMGRQAPDMISAILYASTALLGIDSVTDIWKGSATINKDKNEK